MGHLRQKGTDTNVREQGKGNLEKLNKRLKEKETGKRDLEQTHLGEGNC